MMVLDQVANLKMLIGNQVARRDERACLFPGKVFTLPLDLQMRFGKLLTGLLAVPAFLLLARELALQAF